MSLYIRLTYRRISCFEILTVIPTYSLAMPFTSAEEYICLQCFYISKESEFFYNDFISASYFDTLKF